MLLNFESFEKGILCTLKEALQYDGDKLLTTRFNQVFVLAKCKTEFDIQ